MTASADGRLPCVIYLHCEWGVGWAGGGRWLRVLLSCGQACLTLLLPLGPRPAARFAAAPTGSDSQPRPASTHVRVPGGRRHLWPSPAGLQPPPASSCAHPCTPAGNSGSRRDAEEILFHLLPKGITIFAFDFAVSLR